MAAFIWALLYWEIDYWHPIIVKYVVHSPHNGYIGGVQLDLGDKICMVLDALSLPPGQIIYNIDYEKCDL